MEESIEEKYSESFSPIVGDKPYVLILGTIPGNDSIRLKQYYANPRNLFWEIIHSLFNRHIANEYEKNTEFLKTKNIAIWDVCLKGKRESSLDSDISDEFPNDLQTFIHNYPSIKLIAFNGQKAEKLYNKYFKPFKDVEYFTLLSTSPANASYSYNEKFADWKRILDFINM
ncbi:MAG: DNA-deoxyinosine glycosylase [candidate division Zixibacteria bacterium]|nr:DNA-deoxyinosine glycosylase [candidate division Zixibacteria bacterium]